MRRDSKATDLNERDAGGHKTDREGKKNERLRKAERVQSEKYKCRV